MVFFVREEESRKVEALGLDFDKVKAIGDETRFQILKILQENESYPAEVAKELGVSKQKAYYHFQILEDEGLIEENREEKKSGGVATFYQPTSGGFVLDLGEEGEKITLPDRNPEVRKFLNPFVKNGELNGKIVVGSPEKHGPDQVKARDGHLAGELGIKLGGYTDSEDLSTVLDTELFRDQDFDENILMLGGVLTNTVTKKFNDEFPVSFEGEEFPYRELGTPKSTYSDDDVGVIAKTRHPLDRSKRLYMVAGVREKGTRAAVKAFKDLEELVEGYSRGDYYILVRGLDMDGDGEIDDYEVLEVQEE